MSLGKNETCWVEKVVPKEMTLRDVNNYCELTGAWIIKKQLEGEEVAYFRYVEIKTSKEYEDEHSV